MANLSRLQGVNRVLMNCGVRPVTALDTGNASEAADAERILDFESRTAQLAAWHDNVAPCIKHVADPTTGLLILGATIIGAWSAGPNKHRSLTWRLNGSTPQVFDLNRATFVFGLGEEIFLDLLFEIPFEGAAPSLQEVILKAATEVYARQFSGNPWRDQQLKGERLRAEVNINRGTGQSQGGNAPPFAMQSPPGPGQ